MQQDGSPACKALWCETQFTGTVAISICRLPAAYCFWSETHPVSDKLLQSSVHLAKLSYKIHLSTIADSSELENIRLQSFHKIIIVLKNNMSFERIHAFFAIKIQEEKKRCFQTQTPICNQIKLMVHFTVNCSSHLEYSICARFLLM